MKNAVWERDYLTPPDKYKGVCVVGVACTSKDATHTPWAAQLAGQEANGTMECELHYDRIITAVGAEFA